MTRKKKETHTLSSAELVGAGLAHVQHAFDGLFAWGFGRLKAAGKPRPRRTGKRYPALEAAEGAGRAVLSFLGKAGESYYKEYTGLKKDH